MNLILSRDVAGDRPWVALDFANMPGAKTKLIHQRLPSPVVRD